MQTRPGRLVTPVNMASYDTWIKQYRPDENTANTTIDYYPKGAVIAFLLDAKIRKATNGTKTLDDGMQIAMQRYGGAKGYTPEQFYTLMSEVAGVNLKPFFAVAAESTDELDYTEALDYFGLRFRPVDTANARPFLGAITRNDSGRLMVTGLRRGTAAMDAGLNVDDEILAIDDVRVRADGLAARLEQYRPGDKVQVLVARRDRLTRLDVTLGSDPGTPLAAGAADRCHAEQKARSSRVARAIARQSGSSRSNANQTTRFAVYMGHAVARLPDTTGDAPWLALSVPVAAGARSEPPVVAAAFDAVAVVASESMVIDGRLDERTWEHGADHHRVRPARAGRGPAAEPPHRCARRLRRGRRSTSRFAPSTPNPTASSASSRDAISNRPPTG